LVLNVGFVLAPGRIVGFAGGKGGLDFGLRAGKSGFNGGDVLGERCDFSPQRRDLRVNLLQLDQILQIGCHPAW
jgi:hypothetical protein